MLVFIVMSALLITLLTVIVVVNFKEYLSRPENHENHFSNTNAFFSLLLVIVIKLILKLITKAPEPHIAFNIVYAFALFEASVVFLHNVMAIKYGCIHKYSKEGCVDNCACVNKKIRIGVNAVRSTLLYATLVFGLYYLIMYGSCSALLFGLTFPASIFLFTTAIMYHPLRQEGIQFSLGFFLLGLSVLLLSVYNGLFSSAPMTGLKATLADLNSAFALVGIVILAREILQVIKIGKEQQKCKNQR